MSYRIEVTAQVHITCRKNVSRRFVYRTNDERNVRSHAAAKLDWLQRVHVHWG